MILNLTQHAATPEQIEQGLVDYSNRESLSSLLTIPKTMSSRISTGCWKMRLTIGSKTLSL